MSRFDRTAYLRLIRGQTRGFWPRLARAGLRLASVAYGAAVAVRNAGFDRGWTPIHRAAVPVVSVGNLTLGGTGKTPMVEWVARWYRRRGVRVAILSRGYGQAEGLNDEGRVLEENLPDVPHLQDPDRVALAAIATHELESELIVLDDGFQHRRLGRDVDIVLLDALEPFGLGHLFPRGLLREPVRSLRPCRRGRPVAGRSGHSRGPGRDPGRGRAARRALALGRSQARSARPHRLRGHRIAHRLARRPVGRGVLRDRQPRRISAHACNPCAAELLDLRVFPDHHAYSAEDVGSLERWASGLGANLVLTTQKDLVKLRAGLLGPAPLRALRIGLEITAGGDIMDDVLARLLPA